jgi:hypothetical protein
VVSTGYQWRNGLSAKAWYHHNYTNLAPYTWDEPITRHYAFGLSAGYLF